MKSFENDPAVQRQVRELEQEQQRAVALAEREDRSRHRRVLAREVKNRILVYAALSMAAVLIWQKINILIVIPATFTHLLVLFGGVFLVLYLVLSFFFRSE